jgi:hypothetical protein
MTDKINAGRRWVANFATTLKPPCVGDIPHGPVDTRQGAWTARSVGRCQTEYTCTECGLVVYIDSSD